MTDSNIPATSTVLETAFEPLSLARLTLPNRLVRSATYEGMATRDGQPGMELGDLYAELSRGGIGAIITGFAFTAQEGRAMQGGQCGMETDERIAQWRAVLSRARQGNPETRLLAQLAHAGRQTRASLTGRPVLGASSRRCTYFRQRVRPMSEPDIRAAIAAFANAARRAREAGFDGVQIHAAHGYLIHQFLSPWTNGRDDLWGDRPRFLEEVLIAVQQACGKAFPILVKLSAADDNTPGIRLDDTIATVRRIARVGVDAVEVSYGTMEYALNIIRGACPTRLAMRVNPLFRERSPILLWLWRRFLMNAYVARFRSFAENYNLAAAVAIRRAAGIPVIVTGGVVSAAGVIKCLAAGADAVAMCRALIREPHFPRRLRTEPGAVSGCTHCNRCTIQCDGDRPLRCYQGKEDLHESE